jgi:hypothetical protein
VWQSGSVAVWHVPCAMWCDVVRCDVVRCGAMWCDVVWRDVVQCGVDKRLPLSQTRLVCMVPGIYQAGLCHGSFVLKCVLLLLLSPPPAGSTLPVSLPPSVWSTTRAG